MAAAEARAAWQRTANRCFVQEDAKRAPKLACPSSEYPPSSKLPCGSPTDTPDELENPGAGFMPLNRNSSNPNLPLESRWWLQTQPDFAHLKGLTHEQLNTVGAEMDNSEAKLLNVAKKETEMGESYELLETDSLASKKVDDLGIDSESIWAGSRRAEPWWRVVDRDELASLVSQRSHDLIENCDLPRPQNRSIKKEPHDLFWNYGKAAKALKTDDSIPEVAYGAASCEDQSQFGPDRPSSDETIRTKVQLMEALRHSQTRAREAEKAAKQANAEKEHVIKLFFKQASHLFAYKQWFQLLQLENIYSHITPNKDTKLPKCPKKPMKAKKGAREPDQDFGKFTVAFALGLGLVGAGLFLGWTVAWMLPGL